jgi:membrane-bound serine protease (ClpP class)
VGLLCLLLAAIGLNVLPVNLGGVALLVVAVALLIAELFVGAYGLLALGAFGCLLLGSAMLIDDTDPRFFADTTLSVSWGAVLPLAFLLVGATLTIALLLARVQRKQSPAGAEGIVGELGVARTAVGPDDGSVTVHGEVWTARAEAPIAVGEHVEVVAIDGLRLRVRAVDKSQQGDSNAPEETGT